jgi:hypothetical protein
VEAPHSVVGTDTINEIRYAATAAPSGCFVEVGVYRGGTAFHLWEIAKRQFRRLYLYDTFTGIPYKGPDDTHDAGDFSDCNAEDVQRKMPGAIVVQGVFPESARMDMDFIAFAHLDCDQYKSYRDAIGFLLPRMVRGGVMWFDDSPCLNGAHKAVSEFFPPERLYKSTSGKHLVFIP